MAFFAKGNAEGLNVFLAFGFMEDQLEFVYSACINTRHLERKENVKLFLFANTVGNDRKRTSSFQNAIRFDDLRAPYSFKRGANVEGYPYCDTDFLIG